MGIETIIAIAAVAVSAAGTAEGVHQSNVAGNKADKAQKAQEKAVRDQNAKLADETAKNDATTAARTARMRQRALLAGNQGNSSTIATSPLGLAGGSSAGGSAPLYTELGQ